jgi:hypothetical protein
VCQKLNHVSQSFCVGHSLLDNSSHLGKRNYLPWEWEFPNLHILSISAAPSRKARLATRQIASTSNNINRCNTTHQKAHYSAYRLNSKAKPTRAIYQCLALVSSNQAKNTKTDKENQVLVQESRIKPRKPRLTKKN